MLEKERVRSILERIYNNQEYYKLSVLGERVFKALDHQVYYGTYIQPFEEIYGIPPASAGIIDPQIESTLKEANEQLTSKKFIDSSLEYDIKTIYESLIDLWKSKKDEIASRLRPYIESTGRKFEESENNKTIYYTALSPTDPNKEHFYIFIFPWTINVSQYISTAIGYNAPFKDNILVVITGLYSDRVVEAFNPISSYSNERGLLLSSQYKNIFWVIVDGNKFFSVNIAIPEVFGELSDKFKQDFHSEESTGAEIESETGNTATSEAGTVSNLEKMYRKYLRAKEYYVRNLDLGSIAGGEIDALATKGNEAVIVECKDYRTDNNPVNEDDIRVLKTRMDDAKKHVTDLNGKTVEGWLVTTGRVSKAARAKAEDYNIKLIEPDDIAQQFMEKGIIRLTIEKGKYVIKEFLE